MTVHTSFLKREGKQMSINRIMLMRAIDCCVAEDCKNCPTNNGQDNCVKELLRAAKEYILHLEPNAYLTRSDFAKFLIERSKKGVVDICDLADHLKECKNND